jgi:phospholipid/cholesterol/gamma-HCH transport system ATP-binding protein
MVGMAAPSSLEETAEPLIRFRRVRKAFGPKVVYDGLDLDVRAGESLTIIGGSGVGKSVMLKMLMGLLQVDAGSILFHGEDVTKIRRAELGRVRQRIGMLFQGAALFDSISVGANVAYGLHEHFYKQMNEAEISTRVAWALGLVGLPGIEDMRPADLSGGMKKRVGLARAIAIRPEVILYDEPTTGLDPINTTRINHLITGLKEALSITSIVVTHDMASAFLISDRLAMVHRGRIVAEGTPEKFKSMTDPRVADFIHGRAPPNEDVATLLGH